VSLAERLRETGAAGGVLLIAIYVVAEIVLVPGSLLTLAARPDSVLADLQERLSEWRSLLHDQTPRARGLLKQLIVGRLQMTPHRDEGYYTFNGTGTLLPVIVGVVPQSVASLMRASWNQIAEWLRLLEGLRRAS
jgi:hypothetical protein